MTWRNHETIGKVNKVWTRTPQEMLDEILKIDKENGLHKDEDYSPTFYIGKRHCVHSRGLRAISRS